MVWAVRPQSGNPRRFTLGGGRTCGIRLIDADLGGGIIKQRLARPGEGKAKGYRSLVVFRKGDRAFFVYGFPKNELGNIRDDEAEQLKKAAKSILAFSDDQICQLIENGQFEEVMKDG